MLVDPLGLANGPACVASWAAAGAACGGGLGWGLGGAGGAVGGGAACTFVAPGVGTIGCGAVGGSVGSAAGAAAGAAIGGGIGGWIGSKVCSATDEHPNHEQVCEENLQRDMATCRALGKARGKKAFRICEQQAMLRYSNCLSNRDGDDGINAPLPPWNLH
jgi:hypothetical protein